MLGSRSGTNIRQNGGVQRRGGVLGENDRWYHSANVTLESWEEGDVV